MTKTKLTITNEALDDGAIKQVADLYKRVFATPPWNEAYICTSQECGKNYGLTEANLTLPCAKCGEPLREYYDLNVLSQEIAEISQRTGFRIATLLADEKLAGFWYGWEGDLEEINSQKLGLSPEELSIVQDRLPKPTNRDLLYLAEFGINPENRGRGLGKDLFRYGLDRSYATRIIARTTPSSPAYFINKQNGFKTIWTYTDGTNRVIMARILPDYYFDGPCCR